MSTRKLDRKLRYQVLNIFSCIFFILLAGFNTDIYNIKLYVDTNGNNNNVGTESSPLKSLEGVQNALLKLKGNKRKVNVQIIIREGVYELDSKLVFKTNNTLINSVEIKAHKNEKVVISGGEDLPHKWVKESTNSYGNVIWKIYIPEVKYKRKLFRQLFANGTRLKRASSSFFFTTGPKKEYTQSVKRYDFSTLNKLRDQKPQLFSTFRALDFPFIKDVIDAEIILYHSWDTSWHSISKIDSLSKDVYLKTPFVYPIGFFSNKVPFRIENVREFFDEEGEWMLDTKEGYLYYIAKTNENPNEMDFIVPKLQQLIQINGKKDKELYSINFTNINFQYTEDVSGVTYLDANEIKEFKLKCEWLDFSGGYSSYQMAANCGSAIEINSSEKVKFYRCSFKHLGGYGIKINMFSSENEIESCIFDDLGGGGIIIGFQVPKPIQRGISIAAAPSKNTITNCKIIRGGRIHYSSVGIGIIQSQKNLIKNNEVSFFPYSGISCGWTWDNTENFTSMNIIERNNIHNVMQVLADGGGIYTLGRQEGTVIRNNYIHNIKRSKYAIGARNNGIFFDQGSSGMLVEGNVISYIDDKSIRFNKSDSTEIKWGSNFFKKTINKKGKEWSIIQAAGLPN